VADTFISLRTPVPRSVIMCEPITMSDGNGGPLHVECLLERYGALAACTRWSWRSFHTGYPAGCSLALVCIQEGKETATNKETIE
jgi:hypothetical protein